MTGIAESFRTSIKTLREERCWSQTHLARTMHDAGFDWHQTTVSRVEAGERPVYIAEAIHLAELMGSTVNDMVNGFGAARASWLIIVHATGLTERQLDAMHRRVDRAARERDDQVACTVHPIESGDDTTSGAAHSNEMNHQNERV